MITLLSVSKRYRIVVCEHKLGSYYFAVTDNEQGVSWGRESDGELEDIRADAWDIALLVTTNKDGDGREIDIKEWSPNCLCDEDWDEWAWEGDDVTTVLEVDNGELKVNYSAAGNVGRYMIRCVMAEILEYTDLSEEILLMRR